MNLKKLVLTLADGVEETTLRLSRKERGAVSAGDFEDNGQVTILNPDLHLLTMDENKKLSMEVYVKRGRGYVPSDQHENERRKEIGFIAGLHLQPGDPRQLPRGEHARRPADRLRQAHGRRGDQRGHRSRARDRSGRGDPAHALPVLPPSRCPERSWRASSRPSTIASRSSSRPVDELEPVRSGNCLRRTSGRSAIWCRRESEMLQFRNFGKKSLNEISDILQRHGLTFGMSVRRNRPPATYEVQDREELRRLPDVQLWTRKRRSTPSSRTAARRSRAMRHQNKGNKLSRHTAHRSSMMRNLVTSLFEHGRVETTHAKAKAAAGGREAGHARQARDLHARRQAAAFVRSPETVRHLFDYWAGLYGDRNGGYTRILRGGFRHGDGADLAFLELIGPDGGTAAPPRPRSTSPAE